MSEVPNSRFRFLNPLPTCDTFGNQLTKFLKHILPHLGLLKCPIDVTVAKLSDYEIAHVQMPLTEVLCIILIQAQTLGLRYSTKCHLM